MAWRGVGWYRQRWPIAQFFRTLKQQGLQPEDSQRENAGRLIRLTAIAARAACIIMQRVQARDSSRRAIRPDARFVQTRGSSRRAMADPNQTPGSPSRPPKSRPSPHSGPNAKARPRSGTTLTRRKRLAWAAWIIARFGGRDG